jgi:hypothetical protein
LIRFEGFLRQQSDRKIIALGIVHAVDDELARQQGEEMCRIRVALFAFQNRVNRFEVFARDVHDGLPMACTIQYRLEIGFVQATSRVGFTQCYGMGMTIISVGSSFSGVTDPVGPGSRYDTGP